MNPKLYWIDAKGPGRLAISARPRGGDWLVDEVAGWKSQGIDAIVSLLTPEEEQDLQLTAEASASRARQLQFISLPTEDRKVPRSWDRAAKVIREASDLLRQGQTVAIHCRQGIGRSSIIAAAMLVLDGSTPQGALEKISSARGLPVPETAEQLEWIKRFAEKESTQKETPVRVPAR
jgi:protein-tyrosine phosphatase